MLIKMNRITPFLAIIQFSRQSTHLARSAVRHGAAINVAARQQSDHGSCVNRKPGYGSLSGQQRLIQGKKKFMVEICFISPTPESEIRRESK